MADKQNPQAQGTQSQPEFKEGQSAANLLNPQQQQAAQGLLGSSWQSLLPLAIEYVLNWLKSRMDGAQGAQAAQMPEPPRALGSDFMNKIPALLRILAEAFESGFGVFGGSGPQQGQAPQSRR